MRDTIKFGSTSRFDDATPEETLTWKRGLCNPQACLFASLYNAIGVKAWIHFVQISKDVLYGVLGNDAPDLLVHAYTELFLDELDDRWTRLNSYIVDTELFGKALAKLRNERRLLGYGIQVDGRVHWDGASDCFVQLADESVKGLKDLGAITGLTSFLLSDHNLQRLPTVINAFSPNLFINMNYRIDGLQRS